MKPNRFRDFAFLAAGMTIARIVDVITGTEAFLAPAAMTALIAAAAWALSKRVGPPSSAPDDPR